MKPTSTAGKQPAAGTLHVSASQIALLIEVAVLAMDRSQRKLAAEEARRVYIRALTDFQGQHGRVEGRIDPRNPDHAEIIAATKGQYEAYERAKRQVYNVERRLQTACRKAGRVNAERAFEVTQ